VSALNELLLRAGFDTVSEDFFALLCEEKPVSYCHGMKVEGIKELAEKVRRLRKWSILKYGNFKFAFKKWSRMTTTELRQELAEVMEVAERPEDMAKARLEKPTKVISDIEEIQVEDAQAWGYLSRAAQDDRDPTRAEQRARAIEKGLQNYRRYLTFNHMDVYVATSMRSQRDFVTVKRLVQGVKGHSDINGLNLRFFDPTQVYTEDVLCKSLLESLMLKRARCTIYCAQEHDTLGKDSELATSLAQGKPVIVYLPQVEDHELPKLRKELQQECRAENPDRPEEVARKYLIKDCPDYLIEHPQILQCPDLESTVDVLAREYQALYDKKATELLEAHPLAMQVNLRTGVASGILLARSIPDCAKLLQQVMCKELEFQLVDEKPKDPTSACGDYDISYRLKERSTGCTYRVVIGDALLQNSFWNYYLDDMG